MLLEFVFDKSGSNMQYTGSSSEISFKSGTRNIFKLIFMKKHCVLKLTFQFKMIKIEMNVNIFFLSSLF